MGEDRDSSSARALSAVFQPLDPQFIGALRFNEAGLIPAVAQDWLDGAVLMVAWMNQQAIERTIVQRRGALLEPLAPGAMA
jgi:Phosphoribosyl-AMP cyclohydrolase